MPQCTRCGSAMDAGGGLLVRLGLGSLDGYECDSCGTLICSACYNERAVELAGSLTDECSTCDGAFLKR